MSNLNRFTRNMMEKLPSWMKMAKDPASIGAQFLDVFGVTFYEVKAELDEIVADFYIETAHADMIDILYKAPLTSLYVDGITSVDSVYIKENGTDISDTPVFAAATLRAFYKRTATLPLYYLDAESGYLYLRLDMDKIADPTQPFQALVVNGAAHYDLQIHHVWNAFDEFGLLLGLTRLEGERNAAFKERILDVFVHPGNSTPAGIEAGVARELGLKRGDVQAFPLTDAVFEGTLLKADGTPTTKMIQYAKQVNESLKFTWDTLNFGEAYWHSIEESNLGIAYLPHIWDFDTSTIDTDWFQSGIGDGDDLLVSAPTEQNRNRTFQASLGLVAYEEQAQALHPEIQFQYKIYATGEKKLDEFPAEPFNYTVTAARCFDQEYEVRGTQKFPYIFRTDFDDTAAFNEMDSDKLHFGRSNEFLHRHSDAFVRLHMDYVSGDKIHSNGVKDLRVNWVDTAQQPHTLVFDSAEDFENGPVEGVEIYSSDLIYNETEGLALSYGAFQKRLDSSLDWENGSFNDQEIALGTTGIRLNLTAFEA